MAVHPPPPPETGQAEGPTLPVSPIVLAAQQVVVDVFNTLATQLPTILKAQSPPDSPAPQFTETMIHQLQEQVSRALGLPPDKPGSPP